MILLQRTFNWVVLIAIFTLFTACNHQNIDRDAYGNFEAVEVIVSSESNGLIKKLLVNEGDALVAGEQVGLIDTIVPTLQMVELKAQQQRIKASVKNVSAQTTVLEKQKNNLTVDLKRVENMIKTGAATQKQLDDINGNLDVINAQILANTVQKEVILQEVAVLDAKNKLLMEQLNKCHITNTIDGTVLEKFAEAGEITAAGKPLYKIANLEKLILKAYVSGGQLGNVVLGKSCKVFIDKGNTDYETFQGTITWIANKAEFTPKIIQTKEERVSMVYAIKIEVDNNGAIKIGMPGEVEF